MDILNGADVKKIRKALATDKNQFVSCGRCAGINYWKSDFQDHIKAVKSMFRKDCKKGKMLRMQF
jgi:hypothetical protein